MFEEMPVDSQTARDPDETIDLKSLVAEVIAEPDQWLNAPNDQLGGKTPQEQIDDGRDDIVRGLLRAIKHGMPT
jgi:hypothetical protein